MKRTLLIAVAILGTAAAASAQDVARPERSKAGQQEAPPMRTRTQVQRAQGTATVAPAATNPETQVAKPQPAVQTAAPAQAATVDAPPMRTRRPISPAGANR